jgi:SAM-dependent methyltransferase
MAAQAPDWSAGHYETFAAELEPAAERLVELAAPTSGERVLDLATGTGNAALAAARRGALATGVDSAARLLEVARTRAGADGLDAEFLAGDMLEPPVAAESYDLVLSAFGVIFAADPSRALAAVATALRPGGRALVTAWVPDGAISAVLGLFARAVADANDARPAERFPWHEAQAVAELARPYGAKVRVHDEELAIRAASPREYLDLGERDHPLSPSRRAPLERAGTYAATYEEALAILERANEDPDGFLVQPLPGDRAARLSHARQVIRTQRDGQGERRSPASRPALARPPAPPSRACPRR